MMFTRFVVISIALMWALAGSASISSSLRAETSAPPPQAQWQDVIRNLRHPDVKVRLAAVEQLGNAGYAAAAEQVAPLVTDPDDRVQFAAIDAELTFFLV